MDSKLKNILLKRTVDDYYENVLDPLETKVYDEIAFAFEALEHEGNNPAYFRGKIAGLKRAVELLKELQRELYKEEEE